MKNKFVIPLLLILFCLPAVKSLLQPGGYNSIHFTYDVIRQIDMDKLLGEGQFPPRWSGDLDFGYGYPLFLFNYPLPPLLGEIFVKLGFSYLWSVKTILILAVITSALGMYLFLNSLFKSKLSAFLGAIFYVYAPFRFVLLYVLAAIGPVLALSFLPFILWALHKVQGKQFRQAIPYLLVGSVSLAGMALSHNSSALVFAPIILIFGYIITRFEPKKDNSKYFINFSLIFLLGAGLCSFLWLPAVFAKQYIRWDQVYNTIFIGKHFPTFYQLLFSPWGYGFDFPGTDHDQMSLQIGWAQILVILLVTISLWFFRKVKQFRLVGGGCLALFLITLFLMLQVSIPIWDFSPILRLMEFPWRLLILVVFVGSIVAALLVKYLPKREFVFIVLLVLVLFFNKDYWGVGEVNFPPGYYLNYRPSTISFNEDLPIWAIQPKGSSVSKLEFLNGSGNINFLDNRSNRVEASLESTQSAKLVFNQFYFPGWNYRLDGKNIPYNYQSKEKPGLPIFEVQNGQHIFKAEFKNTLDRNIADTVSTLSLIIWLSLLGYWVVSLRQMKSLIG